MMRKAATATREAVPRAADSAEQIYEPIKTMAMTFAIRPGERVNEVELARSLNTQQEHLRIVKALKDRDAPAAMNLIEGHISRRLDRIVDVIRMGYAEIYMRGQRNETEIA